MTDADVKGFHRVLTKLAAVYGTKVEPDMVDGYFQALKHFSLEVVERACQSAVDDCQFFPKPVELRGYAHEPERFDDDEPTYKCLRCHDKAVIVTDRVDAKGRALGTFAAPCSCAAGDRLRASWEVKPSHGPSMADEAKRNTEKLRKVGAL